MEIDIFSKAAPLDDSSERYVNLKEGESLQGTYIGKKEGVIDTKYKNEKVMYRILTPDGVKRIEFSVHKPVVKAMESVKIGQIIGFKFSEKGVSKNGNSYNKIDLYADPRFIDTEWLKNNEVGAYAPAVAYSAPAPAAPAQVLPPQTIAEFEARMNEGAPTSNHMSADYDGIPPFEDSNDDVLLKEIFDLTKEKFGVIDPTKVENTVMIKTQIAFLPANYPKIITALKAM